VNRSLILGILLGIGGTWAWHQIKPLPRTTG